MPVARCGLRFGSGRAAGGAADVVEFFRQYYGPTNCAFASLGESDAKKLRAHLEALWSAHNRGRNELTVVASEYLEVIAVKA
jgi:predicted Zn-dependent peptidase